MLTTRCLANTFFFRRFAWPAEQMCICLSCGYIYSDHVRMLQREKETIRAPWCPIHVLLSVLPMHLTPGHINHPFSSFPTPEGWCNHLHGQAHPCGTVAGAPTIDPACPGPAGYAMVTPARWTLPREPVELFISFLAEKELPLLHQLQPGWTKQEVGEAIRGCYRRLEQGLKGRGEKQVTPQPLGSPLASDVEPST